MNFNDILGTDRPCETENNLLYFWYMKKPMMLNDNLPDIERMYNTKIEVCRSFQCNCKWSGHHWSWKQQKHWCMHSSAVDLITATACRMESATVCWQSCRLFRTQQCMPLLEPGSSTTSLQFCVTFTGFQSGSTFKLAMLVYTLVLALSGTILPGWHLHSHLVRPRRVIAAVGE